MQLYFIRHAQSANNKLYAETSSWDGRDSDPELTALGHQQARLLAGHLAYTNGAAPDRDSLNRNGFGLTQLYTSLMVRAINTGTYIAEALRLPLLAWEDLHEIGGIFVLDAETGEHIGQPGKPRSEFITRFPQLALPEALGEDGWWNRSHESVDQQARRARRFVYDLIERHGGTEDHVAIISHGGFYNFVLAELLGTQAEHGFWFGINNTGVTRFDFMDEGIALMYANRLEHLPAELIT